MSEWRSFAHLFRTPKGDVAVLLTTFLLTVLIDLTVAVQVGVVLAAFLFIKRMADVTNVGAVTRELTDAPDGTMAGDADGVSRRTIPEGVEVYEVNGPFFFGAADKIKDVLHFVAKKPRVFILRMRNVPLLDASGIRVLDDLHGSFAHQGIRFVISGIPPEPLAALERAGRLDAYGRENIVASLDDALASASSSARPSAASS
jgi:SulP family sulfate permease